MVRGDSLDIRILSAKAVLAPLKFTKDNTSGLGHYSFGSEAGGSCEKVFQIRLLMRSVLGGFNTCFVKSTALKTSYVILSQIGSKSYALDQGLSTISPQSS